jgi:hypothetical protein
VLGVYHGHFELRASLSCGGGEALVDYDPAAGTSTVLLGPTVNGGGVIDALSYPGYEQRKSLAQLRCSDHHRIAIDHYAAHCCTPQTGDTRSRAISYDCLTVLPTT